jgi:hypothetical protein
MILKVIKPNRQIGVRFTHIFLIGAATTTCCARLLVARANRAVTVFVVTFNVNFAVFILSFRCSPFAFRLATPACTRLFYLFGLIFLPPLKNADSIL